jgi:crotonobetainyl-CoA:carnitine CoA-transferase CaiB-like acyl-CoA transferase
VTKLEPPGGDRTRLDAPSLATTQTQRQRAVPPVDTNKRSIVANLATSEGIDLGSAVWRGSMTS